MYSMVVYMSGTSIGFSVSSSCLRTKEQGVVGEQGIVGLQSFSLVVLQNYHYSLYVVT